MTATILPKDVTEHLEAAIQLSNRRIHLRFLDEAEALLASNSPTAAMLIAGVVLESILAGLDEQGTSEDRQRVEKWAKLRNSAAHAHPSVTVTLDQAREMIEDVRRSLMRVTSVSSLVPPKPSAEAPGLIRGKYKFVPTSAAEFISRKADELRLEHLGHDENGH